MSAPESTQPSAAPAASNPPPPSTRSAASSSTSRAVSGNFKGIMICERPAGDGSGAQAGKPAKQRPFISAVSVSRPIGHAQLKGEASSLVKPKKKRGNVANRRHKQWLAELAKERQKLMAELLEQADGQDKKLARFREQQAKKRAAIRGEESVGGEVQTEQDASLGNKSARVKKGKKAKAKPAWALTEEQHEQEQEEQVEELLDFAGGLDFDQYMEELEEQVEEQVREEVEAEAEAQAEAQAQAEAEAGAALAEEGEEAEQEEEQPDESRPGTGMSLSKEAKRRLKREAAGDDASEAGEDDASVCTEGGSRVMARSVLNSSRSIRSVHSTASLAALIERRREAQAQAIEPRVSTIQERESLRSARAKDTSQLPYLYRNPYQ